MNSTMIRLTTAALSASVLALPAALPHTASAAGTHAATAKAGAMTVSAFDSLAMIKPRSPETGAAGIALTAARNEFESFQLKVDAGASARSAISVSLLRPFANSRGTIPAGNVRIYREEYYTPTTMSDGDLSLEFPRDAAGTCLGDCRIPDALIPELDTLVQQNRKAFPTAIPAGENRVAWVDVLVPAAAGPGTYTATFRVTSGAALVKDVTVTLEVLAALVPSTPTMASQVMVNYNDIAVRNGATVDAVATWARYAQLAELGLDNRIAVVMEGGDPRQGTSVLGPLLAGTDPKVRLRGARLTAIPFSYAPGAAAWKQALSSIGYAEAARFWCDEIAAAACTALYDQALTGFPGVRLQAIPRYLQDPNASGSVEPRTTTVVPLVNGLEPKRGEYAAWKAAHPGAELWAYTACMSGGCTTDYTPDPFWTGWAGYGIDQPATAARAMGWHGVRFGLTGEHYWAGTHGFAQSWNACTGVKPTNCLYTVGGESGMNGDGLLFYAPNAAKVGGATPIPVESIRLKRFRDGREDNDLLGIAARAGRSADVAALAAATYPNFKDLPTPAEVAAGRVTLERYLRGAGCR